MAEIGSVTVNVEVEPTEEFDAVARTLGYVRGRRCHDVSIKPFTFACSECGCELDVTDIGCDPTMRFNGSATEPSFCPHCGARVVDE